eukprot:GILK01011086.1.p1 GENE.GILK01011086.1~~GILK01011086.1.p1  ORF type:complete len:299 (-),score=37.85 GILK01011086.1:120-965(-)
MDVRSCTDESLLQTGSKRRTRKLKTTAVVFVTLVVAVVATIALLMRLDAPHSSLLRDVATYKSDSKIIASIAVDTFGFDQAVLFHRSGGVSDNEETLPQFGNLAIKSRQNASLSFSSSGSWYWVSFAPHADDDCHFTVGLVRSETTVVPFRYVSGKDGECKKRYVVESKSAIESNVFSFSFFESMEACLSNSDCHVGFACSRQDNGAGYCKPIDKPSGLLCDRDDNCPPFSVCESSQCEAVDEYGPQSQECQLEKKEETCPPTFECKIKKDKKKAKCSAKG